MMEWVANNIKEARDFFLSNSSDSILCRHKDGRQRITDSYPDAEMFFLSEQDGE